MAVAVEVDFLVVRGSVVERFPAGDFGHVDIGGQLEPALFAALQVILHVQELLGRGDEPGLGLGALAAVVAAGIEPAFAVQGDRVHATALDDLLTGEGDVADPGHVPGRHRKGEDGSLGKGVIVPGSGHPGGEDPVLAQGGPVQGQAQFTDERVPVAGVKERRRGRHRQLVHGLRPFGEGNLELEHAALPETAAVRGSPVRTEFEGIEAVHITQEGEILQVRLGVVALLHLGIPGKCFQGGNGG